jgi:lipooligosaccharide transport system ATP-binding protein
MTTLSPVTLGNIQVMGMDPARAPNRIKAAYGVVPRGEELDPVLSVMENLPSFVRYFDIPPKEATCRA